MAQDSWIISLKRVRLHELITQVNERYGAGFLHEATTRDASVQPFEFRGAPEAFPAKVCSEFSLEHARIAGIGVFRSRRWTMDHAASRTKGSVGRWLDAGAITVKRQGWSGPIDDENLPARQVAIVAREVPVKVFAERLSQTAKWNVSVPLSLSGVRVSAALSQASVGQVVDALAYLLNVTPTVSMAPSPYQKHLEEVVDAALRRNMAEREIQSAEIREALEGYLTPDQREKIARGEEVGLGIGGLSPDLQASIKSMMTGIANRIGIALDLSRYGDFQIVFPPPQNAPGGALGIHGWGKDGIPVHF